MSAKHFYRILLTLTAGLTVTAAGAVLTWYQVSDTELRRTATAAREVVSVTERLLDEAHSAIDLSRPMLTQPCTPEIQAELGRLAIGIEHIRVINIFRQNLLYCSSYDGADPVREFISAGDSQTLLLATDDYISPGEPVMILRRNYGHRSITASVATQWTADALRLPGIRRALSLRTGSTVLTRDNHLMKAPRVEDTHAVHSGLYPFSVEYPGIRSIPLALYLHEGALSLLLSALLGTTMATALWLVIFRRRTLYEELHRAVRKGEIVPWYQPIVDASTGRMAGVEVLARWKKPDGTVLSPAIFIAEAENSDLIVTLTRHLMECAARELPPLLSDQPQWHIGFNVTHTHILETGFITECQTFMSAFPPDSISLTIELTERERFDSSEEMRNRLKRLNTAKVTIALDDFGTGYANMEYLSEIPMDVIKIDRVFVSRIGQGYMAEQLLLSLFEMARALNMEIVAEGVETEAQANWLKERGVSWQQGYFYSPPVPLNKLKKHLSID